MGGTPPGLAGDYTGAPRLPIYNPLNAMQQEYGTTEGTPPPPPQNPWTAPEVMTALDRMDAADAAQRMTSIPNVRSLTTNPLLTERSFLTPRGTASVSFGQPKREAIIEGLPASEYFQRAANRQGDNKFAKSEKGTEGSKEMADKKKANLRKAGVK